MEYVIQIGQWIYSNPATAGAIALAIYAFWTKKITLGGLIAEIMKDIGYKPKPVEPIDAPPVPPVPNTPDTFTQLFQMLVALLNDARQKGDKDQEQAVVTLLNKLSGANNAPPPGA